MFSEEQLKKAQEMEERWKENLDQMKADPSPMLTPLKPAKGYSGIELKPTYGPLDIKDIPLEDIGMPGEFPYTRGNRPVHYQMDPLMYSSGFGFNSPEETAERRNFLHSIGQRFHIGRDEEPPSHVCVIDLPTQYGLDPDDPLAQGKVGDCGTSISTIEDLKLLYDGLDPEKTLILAGGCSSNVIALNSMFAHYVTDIRKLDLAKTIQVTIIMYHHGWGNRDHASYPPKTATKLSVETIKFYTENVPKCHIVMDHGYDVAEAGSTPVIEIAFSIANCVAVLEECAKAGMDVNKAAAKIVAHPHLNMNFLETIAKLRAWRRVWAKTMKEKLGCTSPLALRHDLHPGQCAGTALPSLEIHNNIIRITVMALAGMLADIEAVWVASYDEALCIPTEDAVKMAVRTGQILVEETDIPHVTDPLGGSYCIEALTSRIEEEAYRTLKKIDDLGGYYKAWESGWMRGEVERAGNERMIKIDRGEMVKVGLNKYKTEDVSPYQAFSRPSEESVKRIIERVQKYRADRDQTKTDIALAKVREACLRIEHNWPESCGELHQACIEAARAKATAGEMGKIFREVFGFGYYSG